MTDALSLYGTALQNTRALEQQGLTQMEHQVDGLAEFPRYAAVLRARSTVTKGQITRLDQALAGLDAHRSGLREAVTKTAGAIGAAVHGMADDSVLKNLFAGYAFQYDQVAAYRSLIVLAKAAGREGDVSGFETSVQEEKAGAAALDEIIEVVTTTYLKVATTRKAA